jgi:hypothetical protein
MNYKRNPQWTEFVRHHISHKPYHYAKSTYGWSEFAVAQTVFARPNENLHWHSFDSYTYVLAYREFNSFDIYGDEQYTAYVHKDTPYDYNRFIGTTYWRRLNELRSTDERYAFDVGNLGLPDPGMKWVQYNSNLEPFPTVNDLVDPGIFLDDHKLMTITVDRIDPVWKTAALEHYATCMNIIADHTNPLYVKYLKLSARLNKD